MAESLYKAGYRDTKTWNPPRVGSEARSEIPRGYFLGANRTYPVYKIRDGKPYLSLTGAVAAWRRAILNGDTAVERKALRLINRLRKEQGLEPWEGRK